MRPTTRSRALLVAWLALLPGPRLHAQTAQSALEAWQTGHYDEAIQAYQALAARPGAPIEIHRALVRVLLEVGRTDDATKHVATAGGGAQLANVLGEAQLAAGQWDAAEKSFLSAAQGGASDAVEANANLAALLWDRGRHSEALRLADTLDRKSTRLNSSH